VNVPELDIHDHVTQLTRTHMWRPVVGYEGHYEVSDAGRVRSLKRGRVALLKYRVSTKGYPFVQLYLNGKQITRYVHALVAEAFNGPRPDGLEVRHLDGDNTNNVPSNLTYGTHAENIQDAIRHGTFVGLRRKPACKWGHEWTPQNTYIRASPTGRPVRHCRACAADRQRQRRRAA
jgi:hypothetical protein